MYSLKTEKKTPYGIYLLAFLSMFFWGLSFVWVKIVYRYYDPLTTIYIRLVLSSLILIALAKIIGIAIKPKREDYKAFFFLAFLEPFAYFIGESFGLKLVSSSVAAIMIATIPMVTPFFARTKLNERIGLMNYLGIIISFGGILLMILKKDLSPEYSPLGILLLLLAVLSGAYYTVQLKPLSARYHPFTIIIAMNVIGSFYFLPCLLYFEFEDFIHIKPNAELLTAMGELILFSSIMALVFFVKVVEHIGAAKTAVFTNLIPVVTLIAAWFLLPDEVITLKMIIGIFIVIGGVFIAQYPIKR